MSSFVVTFNLKFPYKGDAVPIIYGNCKELGNGEPTRGVEFTSEPNLIYNYQAKIRFSKEVDKDTIWYSYCFRPSYGSIILENAPHRFLPQIHLNQNRPDKRSIYSSPSITLYDTIDEITPIDDFILHFRVRCFTQFGQNLYICGSCESLGNWDPHKAIQLFYEGNQDYWSGNVKIPLSDSPRVIEYKYFRSYVPLREQKETKSDNNQRINAYRDMYKDFYRRKNPSNIFFNSRIRNFQETEQKTSETAKTNDTKKDNVDLNGIEWEPIDVQNHRIEIGPVTSPTVLEVSDTFRWSDPSQEILTRSPFVNSITARQGQNKVNSRIDVNNSKPDIVTVRFEALCPNITKDQELFIVGSNAELGDWQISKGRKMDDSNFPLFVTTIDMKREKRKDGVKQSSSQKEPTTKTAKVKESLFSFPFEFKFVAVGDELKDVEVEVEDDSPLSEEERDKLEQMKAEEQVKKEKSGDKIPINEEALIRSMHRTKKVVEKRIEKVGIWESSPNRYCPGITSPALPDHYPSTLLINSWYVNPNPSLLKRFGVSVPLFSVRSSDTFGVGQFNAIRQLVDFSKRVGCSLIQLSLPLFDTSTAVLQKALKKPDEEIKEFDANPFNIISAFALHPIYISLSEIIPSIPKGIREEIEREKEELERKATVDYKRVYSSKMKYLLKIYRDVVVVDKKKSDPTSKDFDYSTFYQSKMGALLLDDSFDKFVEREKDWLLPYSLFCFFREKHCDSDFRNWPREISCAFEKVEDKDGFDKVVSNLAKSVDGETAGDGEFEVDLTFFLWLQYVCFSQFGKASAYAKKNGVCIAGDLSLNVAFRSVECWCHPSLFRHRDGDRSDWSYRTVVASSEPNSADMSLRPIVDEENYVYPSFDWTLLDQTAGGLAVSWWKRRSEHCHSLFDALKVGPSLALCRCWEVDAKLSATACLGRFLPCEGVTREELDRRNLKDIGRYTRPHVRRGLLAHFFGKDTSSVESIFFDVFDASCSLDPAGELLSFKPSYDSERKLYDAYITASKSGTRVVANVSNEDLFERLIRLVDDVLLIEDAARPGHYYVRLNFFYEPAVTLKSGANKVVDLVPSSSYSELPNEERVAMRELYDSFNYASQDASWLRLARLKEEALQAPHGLLFVDAREVEGCGSLSHEFRDEIARRWRSSGVVFLRLGDARFTSGYMCAACSSLHNTATLAEACGSADAQEEEVRRILNSPAVLAVFALQDLAGVVAFFRRQPPREERVTRSPGGGRACLEEDCRVAYRLPFSVEEAVKNDELAEKLRRMCAESDRMKFELKLK